MFSDRTSKVVKAYPVTGTSTETAILALEHYLIYVANTLTHKIECIQTDAGSQFVTGEWSSACHERGIKSRTCPVDHQAMNGQVERVQGTLCNLMKAMMKTMHVPREYWYPSTRECCLLAQSDTTYITKTQDTVESGHQGGSRHIKRESLRLQGLCTSTKKSETGKTERHCLDRHNGRILH